MPIHPTAIVHPKAEVDSSCDIGPYVIIDENVKLGPNNIVMAHAYLNGYTTIGEGNVFHMGCVIGHVPQHLAFKGGKTGLRIGNGNTFREYCQVHRGLEEGSETRIGDNNFFMGVSHVAHDCVIGNRVVVANGALLAGHIVVEDRVFISGNVAVHQFVRLGTLAMIGGLARVSKDVPPYMLMEGNSTIRGLNVVGLRRAGIAPDVRAQIRQAYKILYHRGYNVSHALEEIKQRTLTTEIRHLVEFIENSKRGICKHIRDVSGETFEEDTDSEE
ncbi:MAG: acyl-ACP--UDP-N-acetylglucosamine O-acyltransferase [bacterium]